MTTHARATPRLAGSVGSAARRVRPAWSGLVRVLGEFVWADLRAGLIDLRGMSAAAGALVVFGFALLFAMLVELLNSDVWRAQSPLLALPNGVPWRGSLLPLGLVPATLFLLSVAWSYALVGALHAHPLYRLAALFIYVLLGLTWVDATTLADLVALLEAWGLLLAVPIFFALRWRGRSRPGLEFAVVFVLVVSTFGLVQAQGIEAWQISATPLVLSYLGSEVLSFSLLVTPALFLAGAGMSEFALRVADWGVAVARRLPAWAPCPALVVLFLWRLRDVGGDAAARLASDPPAQALPGFVAGLIVTLLVGAAWWLVRRAHGPGAAEDASSELVLSEAGRALMPLILAYSFLNLLTFFVSDLLITLAKLGVARGATLAYAQAASDAANSQAAQVGWRLLVMAGALALGLRVARRGRAELGAYLAIFGLVGAFRELSQSGRPLGVFSDPDVAARVDLWLLLTLAAFGLTWLARRSLTPQRINRLLLLVLLGLLMRQTDFISNRFSVFGFAGVGFLAFGLAWDALTVGAWANVESRALPRTSRVFLYIGYVLLTVAVVNWALTTHDLAAQSRLTGEMALAGFTAFGRPIIYAVFAIALSAPATGRAGVAVPGDAVVDPEAEPPPEAEAVRLRSGPAPPRA